MATKRIETQLTIRAVDQYTGALRGMRTVTGKFATGVRTELSRLQGLRGPLKLIDDFKKQKVVVDKSARALAESRERVRQLEETIRTTKNPTAQMRREFDRARTAASRLEETHKRNRTTLGGLKTQMQRAGVDTSDLASEQRRLAGALDRGTTAFGRQVDRMKRLEVIQKRIADGRKQMDRSLATAANLTFVGGASIATGRRILTSVSAPVREAKEFESAMADVRKVVDFESPEAFKKMSQDILDLSTRIPIAADGLAAIVAAGGQSNIPREELLKFAEMAAKIGVAFDISADHAGTSMSEIKTALRLTLDETGSLFDAMNHLSNNSAARADKLLNFLNSAGADGAGFGFDETETLAIGAAMIAAGAGADTAATSFRNMGRALARGESATERQSSAMAALGLESTSVAKRMQRDAVGTTQDVLRRLSELPAHLRASTMSDLFGNEARELTKLLNNMKLMPDMLALVAKETEYLGSAQAEYEERAKATANNEELTANAWRELSTVAGETVLPVYNELLTLTRDILKSATAWIKEHPKLTKAVLLGGAALGTMAVAGGVLLTAAAALVGTLAVLKFGLVGLGARAVFAAGDVAGVATKFGLLRRLSPFRLSTLITPLKWTAKLIPKIGMKWVALAGPFALRTLVTAIKWTARLIPGIGWAVLAGELLWSLLLKKLPWDDWIDQIGWSNWFDFEWKDFLPEWSWDFIPTLDLSNLIKFPEMPEYFKADPQNRSGRNRRRVQSRASGGGFRSGPLLVGERGPERIWADRSGFVENNRQMMRALSVAQSARAAGVAAITAGLISAPAAASQVGGPSSQNLAVEIGSVNVYSTAPISDPSAHADAIAEKLGERVSAVIAASFEE